MKAPLLQIVKAGKGKHGGESLCLPGSVATAALTDCEELLQLKLPCKNDLPGAVPLKRWRCEEKL